MAVTNPTLWTMRFPAAGQLAPAMADYETAQAERVGHFKKIQPAGNWKMPIDAMIDAADFDDCNEACLWFTGSALTPDRLAETGPMRVTAPGYYATIGA